MMAVVVILISFEMFHFKFANYSIGSPHLRERNVHHPVYRMINIVLA